MPHETVDHRETMSLPGSDAHKILLCRTLLDTFDPYKPAVIDRPDLDATCVSADAREIGVPFYAMLTHVRS
jgi:hypothetical protein